MTNPSDAPAATPGSASSDRPDARDGDTQVTRAGRTEPRLPNEHDTSSDSGRGAPTPEMTQAARDLDAGRKPTDRSTEADEVYRRTLRGQ